MNDVSVEYAHIYTNQKIGDEHRLSLRRLGEIRRNLTEHKRSYSLVIMVDDYSFPDPTFDYDKFINWLAQNGHRPDVVIKESSLRETCDELLEIITDGTLQDDLKRYVREKKYPCSLFIAAWYLLRLGHLKSDIFDVANQAKTLVNILPTSFKPYEAKGLNIIKNTPFFEAVNDIQYEFLDGRSID